MKKCILYLLTSLYSVILSAQTDRITLLFVGDLMQHQAQIDAARTEDGTYNYTACFAKVKEQISKADLAIGNFEVTLGGKPYCGYPTFSAPDEYLAVIKDAGFDLLLTANNHCLDKGKKGLERTILMLDSLRMTHIGTYLNASQREKTYPLIIHKNGFRIAFLNYTYGTNGIPVRQPNIVNYINKKEILQDIRKAQAQCADAIIACMHWGEEYQSLPNKEQRELANWLIEHGVTHIIGSHPHVIQPIELLTEGNQQHLIVYSLGNFISNMSAPRTDGGMMLTLQLEKNTFSIPTRPFPLLSTLSPKQATLTYIREAEEGNFSITTRVADCHYTLVWTARPQQTQKKQFYLLPITRSSDSLPQIARNKLIFFTKEARKLMKEHNIGPVYEKE